MSSLPLCCGAPLAALAQEPSAGPLLAERTRRFAAFDRDTPAPIFDVHEAALRNAGVR